MISVGLELYGYLSHVHVGELGNWTLKDEDIPRATWNLRIVGGPLSDIFIRQADALWDIEQHIIACIQGHGLSVSDVENGRRNGKPEKNLVKTAVTAKHHRKWRIPDVPQLGRRQADGSVRACTPGYFRRGDFMQVSIQFSVERKLDPTPGDVIVRRYLKQIVLLVPAKDTGEGKVIPRLPDPEPKQRTDAARDPVPDEAPVQYQIL
ncbi:hypothetical protein K488DRAFT_74876 [Vararia minispora EC-137]|uniref:Uncharacterized protein n=1 Tax=Vararia minispora EC-137 TaxID=1314806 RepID=A0ACB8Q5Y9_9AGAM|nr:hypothetical protein K488DRAFT_74876 [Vararia minispora EC-137]